MRWSDRIARRIKLSDLHVLLAVANSGSMAKAAKELAVSHPVVSRSISELEQTLGVRHWLRGLFRLHHVWSAKSPRVEPIAPKTPRGCAGVPPENWGPTRAVGRTFPSITLRVPMVREPLRCSPI